MDKRLRLAGIIAHKVRCFKARSTYSELISSKRTITGLNAAVNMQLYKTRDQEKIEYNTIVTLSHTIEDPAKLGREGGKFSVQATLRKLSSTWEEKPAEFQWKTTCMKASM